MYEGEKKYIFEGKFECYREDLKKYFDISIPYLPKISLDPIIFVF